MLLHLFSGRRRPGDLQQYAETDGFGHNRPTIALSVDIVVHLEYGNALLHKTRALFKAAIQQGLITAIVAGPPCQVSQARERGHDSKGQQSRGPRPLRSRAHPEGLTELRIKEVKQIISSNLLWGASIALATASWMAGSIFILEHPAEPRRKEAASIWRLDVIQMLLKAKGIRKLTLHQGLYGARSPKPTTFLLVHGPSEPEAIARQYQTTAVMPPPLAMGKDERGQYRTAPLKEYLPGLCKCLTALVRTALQESQARPQGECTSPLTEFPALAQLHDELEGQSQQEMGPDCNAQALEAMR